MNSFFTGKRQRKWTWASPDGVTKTEIDYIITNRKSTVKNVTVLNKFTTGSDHRMVRAKVTLNTRFQRSKLVKKRERIDVQRLYNDVVAEKVQINSNEKSTGLTYNPASEIERDAYIKRALMCDEELAFEELYSDEKIRQLLFQTDEDILIYIEKIGIVQEINEQFYFIHRSFAEYFVAKYLSSKLRGGGIPEKRRRKNANDDNALLETIAFLFEEILLQPHNEGVRSFFDGILSEMSLQESVLKKCGEKFGTLLRTITTNNTLSPLLLACSERNVSLVYFMINSLIADNESSELLKSLTEAADHKNGETVIFKAAAMCDLGLIGFLRTTGRVNVEALNNICMTVLMQSVASGYPFDVIKSLGGNVNWVNSIDENESVLFKAAQMGNLQVVEFLIKEGAFVNFVTENGITVLHNAIHSGNLDVVRCLVSKGAKVDAADDDGKSVLHFAAYSGNFEICQWLVDRNGGAANFECKTKDGSSILHEASISGNFELCQWLIEELHLSVELQDENGRTALHEACQYNNLPLAQWLVNDKGMSVNSVDSDGRRLFIDAAKYGDSSLCDWLIEQGLKTNVTDKKGQTMLKIAIRYGNLDVLQWLTRCGVYNAANEIEKLEAEDLSFPLQSHLANHQMKWMLLKNSIESKWVAPDGIERHGAAEHRNDFEEIILHLVANGANVNHQSNKDKQTILHCAIEAGYTDLARRLLEMKGKQMDFTLQDTNQKTALDIAKDNNEYKLVRLIEEILTPVPRHS